MSKKYNRWRRKRKGSATGPEERAPSPITEIDLGEQQVIEPQGTLIAAANSMLLFTILHSVENDFEKLKSRLQSRGKTEQCFLPISF